MDLWSLSRESIKLTCSVVKLGLFHAMPHLEVVDKGPLRVLIHLIQRLKIVPAASTDRVVVDLFICLHIVIMFQLRHMPLQPLLLETNLSVVIEGKMNGLLLLIFAGAEAVISADVLHQLAEGLWGLRLFLKELFLLSHRGGATVLIEQIADWPPFLQLDGESS